MKQDDGKWRPERGHRISYQAVNGPLPRHDFVYRKCRNQLCVNPQHLRVRRNRATTFEMRARQRQRATERSKVTRAIQCPTRADIAWAAGFLEGEGNFRAQRSRGMEQIRASQVNPEPLARLVQLFGGSIIPRKHTNPKYQPAASWEVCAARARGIMMTLYPFLSELKRGQVRVALRATW